MSAAVAVPRTLEEALAEREARPEALVVAGGSDLLPALRTGRRAQPPAWLLLHALAPLSGIAALADGGVRIGATTTIATVERNALLAARAPALVDAAALIGSPATRTVATVAGNLVNGSPAMELGAPLLALGAIVELAAAGRAPRRLPLERFLLAPGRVDLRPGELVTAVELPARDGVAGPGGAVAGDGAIGRESAVCASAYVRVGGRAAMEVALAGAAVALTLTPDGTAIATARVALCAVAPTCRRAPAAEALLIGAAPERAALDAAARAAAADTAPIDDHRAPAAYRAAVAEVALRRALDVALARANAAPPRTRSAATAASAPTPPEPASSMPPFSAQAPPRATTLTVNGEPRALAVAPETTLLELLRERLGLTGAKEGCDDGECGACTVLLDGAPVNACILLAAQAGGRTVTTVEGIHGPGGRTDPHPLQRALVAHGAIQCGFCTPGIVVAALAADRTGELRDEPAARRALAGNLCRCTGYQTVVGAVLAWAGDHHHDEREGKRLGPSA